MAVKHTWFTFHQFAFDSFFFRILNSVRYLPVQWINSALNRPMKDVITINQSTSLCVLALRENQINLTGIYVSFFNVQDETSAHS